jgi:CheY-like chemotaxis protein
MSCSTEEPLANKEKQKMRNEKILIVDDEPDITFTLRAVLEENGFKEVDVYNEPLLALQNFNSCVYSLLITDVAMPIMDGFELYQQIKKMDDRIKVVFVTASKVNYQALRELLPAAAILRDDREVERINFIRKPVEIEEFIQRVKEQIYV